MEVLGMVLMVVGFAMFITELVAIQFWCIENNKAFLGIILGILISIILIIGGCILWK